MTAREFIEALPQKVNPAALEGHNTIFHFDVPGDTGGQYTLTIADGKMDLQKGLIGDAKCKVTAKDTDLIGIVTGQVNPMMAFMMGKIKTTNQGELLKYAKVLGLM
jgi:putative sterol carrier protein